MNVLILGAGRVGKALARHLAAEENNNITVVDSNVQRLELLRSSIDVRLVNGIASDPITLRRAEAETADIIIAVTRDDESNILACHIAQRFNSEASKLCRVRLPGYWAHRDLISTDAAGAQVIEHFISPQRIVTEYIRKLIETPGALQVIDFAKGKVRMVAVKIYPGGMMVNKKIIALKSHLPNEVDTRIVALYRGGQPIKPEADTIVQANDEIFFIAEKNHIRLIMGELQRTEKPYKSITIAGGGHIGYRLARALEDKMHSVKIIEHNADRSQYIAERLEKAVVLRGDATDRVLLNQENIFDSDVFMALTNSDEDNIISSMLAKSLHTKKVMTLINKPDYMTLLESSKIDAAISPDLITISNVLAFMRKDDTAEAHTVRLGSAEVLELIVHGNSSNSKTIGKAIKDIDLPEGVIIGAILRQDEIVIAHNSTVIETEDHIIVFVNDRQSVPAVEQLFCIK